MEAKRQTKNVLDGVRVLDCSRFAAGPFCTAQLAYFGADVIKLEMPGGSEERYLMQLPEIGNKSIFSLVGMCNKKSITLDLHHPDSRHLLDKLVAHSDVVVHNFVPGTDEAMIFDYDSFKKINPAIILVAISGFGQYGPYSQRVSFDTVIQAMGGVMNNTGWPDQPPTRSGIAMADLGTATTAALAIMFALYERTKSGVGQMIDLSLWDVIVSWMAALGFMGRYKVTGKESPRRGNQANMVYSDCYKTADDEWIELLILGERLWRRFARAIGSDVLASDPRLGDDYSRSQNYDIIDPIVSKWFAERTAEEATRVMDEARVPSGRVYSIPEIMDDPHIKARDIIVDIEYPDLGTIPAPGVAPKLSRTPGRVETGTPDVGQHNKEVYSDILGLSSEELDRLTKEGVI